MLLLFSFRPSCWEEGASLLDPQPLGNELWVVGTTTSLSHNQRQMRKLRIRKRERLRNRVRMGQEAQTALCPEPLTTHCLSSISHKCSLRKSLHPFPSDLQHALNRPCYISFIWILSECQSVCSWSADLRSHWSQWGLALWSCLAPYLCLPKWPWKVWQPQRAFLSLQSTVRASWRVAEKHEIGSRLSRKSGCAPSFFTLGSFCCCSDHKQSSS